MSRSLSEYWSMESTWPFVHEELTMIKRVWRREYA